MLNIFQVWSVRSCEGSLKKRGHCLRVSGIDARALVAPVSVSGKLSIRRTPADQLTTQTQPRAVLRVANRVNNRDNTNAPAAHDLEPFLQDLQNDVARLSRAFATLGREANALVRSEAEMRARIENRHSTGANEPTSTSSEGESTPTIQNNQDNNTTESPHLTRSARRRMRQRLRAALNGAQPSTAPTPSVPAPPVPAPRAINHLSGTQRQNGPTPNSNVIFSGHGIVQYPAGPPPVALPPVAPPPVAPQPSGGPSNGQPQNGNVRVNKKKRRQRR